MTQKDAFKCDVVPQKKSRPRYQELYKHFGKKGFD